MADTFKVTYGILSSFASRLRELSRYTLTEKGVTATGNLYNSIETKVISNSGVFEVVINLEDYWYYVENGRKPNNKFPPIDEIKNWIQAKPVMPREDDLGRLPTEDQLAYLIGRKIAVEGIEPRPFVQESVDTLLEDFQQQIVNALQEDLGAEVNNIFSQVFANDKFETITIKNS